MNHRPRAFGVRRTAALVLLAALLAGLVTVTRSASLERADFVFNNGTEISTLDPASVTGVPEGRVMYALYEGLTVKHPETLEAVPGMAEAWEVSDDGLTYTFHIREDARWSNGDPLTAHDFEWSWQRVLHPETAAEYSYQLWYVRNAKAYSLLPVDLPDERWWFDAQAYVHWSGDDGDRDRVRVGLHGFAKGAKRPTTDAEVRELVALVLGPELAARELDVNREPFDAAEDDLYEDGWIAELSVDVATLERELPARVMPEARAREEFLWSLVGATATDDHTFVVELESPTPFFLYLTSFYPTFPTHRPTWEWARATYPDTWQIEWIAPENIVTNGPFLLSERRINDRIRMVGNPLYWDAENVAMRTYDILAVESYGTMLNLYLTGEIDWIERCAPNLIPRMMEREDFKPESYLGTYFYRVNVTRPPFDDVRVRRALALAIDRKAITRKITKKGERPSWSVCPGGLRDYPPPEMRHAPVAKDLSNWDAAFAADCDEARALLADAGFAAPGHEGGRHFPTMEIHYNTAETHRDLAEVVADTWKRELGIDVKLLNQEWKVYLDTQNTLGYDVSRSAWIGDYPDPNTFLDLWVTDGDNNRTGWGDPHYDALIARAGREADPAARLAILAEAEAYVLEALPFLPIYSYVSQNVVNPRLGGFHENVMDVHFPKFFYWMDDEELEAKRATQPIDEKGWKRVEARGPREGLYAPARARSKSEAER